MTKSKQTRNYHKELLKLLNYAKPDFSGVRVAAIIVTDKGTFKGVNYEDSVMSLGICAERNAMFNAITNGMKRVYEIHLCSNTPGITMCGACRQVATSFAGPECKIINYGLDGKQTVSTLGQVLPKATFLAKDLKK